MTDTSLPAASKSSKGLNIVLWILQVLLAALFAMAGFAKLTAPIEKLGEQMSWVLNAPVALIRFIGLAEVLGALGLILPGVTKIKPGLTVWAAYGLATIMLLATLFHLYRKEYAHAVTILIGAIALFIAWGRSKKSTTLQP